MCSFIYYTLYILSIRHYYVTFCILGLYPRIQMYQIYIRKLRLRMLHAHQVSDFKLYYSMLLALSTLIWYI